MASSKLIKKFNSLGRKAKGAIIAGAGAIVGTINGIAIEKIRRDIKDHFNGNIKDWFNECILKKGKKTKAEWQKMTEEEKKQLMADIEAAIVGEDEEEK